MDEDEGALVVADAAAGGAAASYELALPAPGGGTRILGSREFARYYK